jgi:hypothetical protein
MRLQGKLAELMVKVAPKVYRKCVFVNRKGEIVLYVKLLNALYGILKAALLFYKKLIKEDLMEIGFKLNPYDPCVADKMSKGKQMTLYWHVDNMKVSHFDKKKVDDMIKWLRLKYEHLFEDGSDAMQICRGKVHEYIGMTLDFTEPGEWQRVDATIRGKRSRRLQIIQWRRQDRENYRERTPIQDR